MQCEMDQNAGANIVEEVRDVVIYAWSKNKLTKRNTRVIIGVLKEIYRRQLSGQNTKSRVWVR